MRARHRKPSGGTAEGAEAPAVTSARDETPRRPLFAKGSIKRVRSDAPAQPARSESSDGDLIPGWLALLVLVLLLGVAALGGYLIRGALVKDRIETPAQLAVDELEQQAETNPDDPEALLALGYAYQQEERFDEALELYGTVLKLDPGNTGALYNKAVVLMQLGKAKEAEAAYWDVLEVAPDHVLAAKGLGEYYVGKKQYKSALVALEPVIVERPQYADLQYLAGYSCEKLGIKDKAIEYYRGALTYDPQYQDAKDGLARLGATE